MSCLNVHLFASGARRIIESLNRPLRPTVAFHEQGHCQEDWRRCGRQSDADPHVTALRETPFEGSTYIVEARKVWRALLSGRIGRSEEGRVGTECVSTGRSRWVPTY